MKADRRVQLAALSEKLFHLADEASKLNLWLRNGASVAAILAMIAVELRDQAKSKVTEIKTPKERP